MKSEEEQIEELRLFWERVIEKNEEMNVLAEISKEKALSHFKLKDGYTNYRFFRESDGSFVHHFTYKNGDIISISLSDEYVEVSKNRRPHNECGPAVFGINGKVYESYYLDGSPYDEEEFYKILTKRRIKKIQSNLVIDS